MKFTIMAGELADAVGWTSHALPKRPAAPVLGGMLVEAGGDGVTLAAFDYDTSRRCSVELDAPFDDGRILLPGRVLAELVKVLPKGELVDVVADGRVAVIQCGRLLFELPLMDVDDYPNLPQPPDMVGSIEAGVLAEAVAHVACAAGTDDSTPMLTCVRVEVGPEGTFDMAATDRYRVAWRPSTWEPALDTPAELAANIPAKILADISRGFTGGPVEVAIGGGQACFTGGGRATTVRLYDQDQFINFRSFAERVDAVRTAEVDAAELAKVVRRVALLAERLTPVHLSFRAGEVLVEAGSADNGRAAEAVDCTFKGDDVMVAFNPKYLVDGLQAAGGTASIKIQAEATRPVLITGTGDPGLQYVVIPIRLS